MGAGRVYEVTVFQYKYRRQTFLNDLIVSRHHARAEDYCGK